MRLAECVGGGLALSLALILHTQYSGLYQPSSDPPGDILDFTIRFIQSQFVQNGFRQLAKGESQLGHDRQASAFQNDLGQSLFGILRSVELPDHHRRHRRGESHQHAGEQAHSTHCQ